MAKYYITLGSAHTHTVADTLFNMHRIAEIEADSLGEARDKACKVFDNKWAFSYNSQEDAGVERFRLTVVPLTDAMIRDELVRREETHLGDAIYAKYDGHHVILYTSRVVPSRANEPQSETIYLNKKVLDNLFEFVKEKQTIEPFEHIETVMDTDILKETTNG